jgi:RNA:NAD 2'-phosphotransferase (TPT1/KptA family)
MCVRDLRFNTDNVTTLIDPKAKHVLQSVGNLSNIMGKDDAAFIYYSGHGNISPDGKEFFFATRRHPLANNQMQHAMQNIKSDNVFLVIDACKSGAYSTSESMVRTQSKSCLVISACRSTETTPVRSVMTPALVEVIRHQVQQSKGKPYMVNPLDVFMQLSDMLRGRCPEMPRLSSVGELVSFSIGPQGLNRDDSTNLSSLLRREAPKFGLEVLNDDGDDGYVKLDDVAAVLGFAHGDIIADVQLSFKDGQARFELKPINGVPCIRALTNRKIRQGYPPQNGRLNPENSKALTKVLRYDARKHGLPVKNEGYICLDDVVKLLRLERQDVIAEVLLGYKDGQPRSELRHFDGVPYIRALRNRQI